MKKKKEVQSMHSRMFEKIKNWYENGDWNKTQVGDAVAKGRITEDEFEEIVGEPYIPRN